MASVRRLLRMMAGQLKSPADRAMERQARTDKRVMQQIKSYAAWGELIERRQKGDTALPPMPFDFQEIERRRREGTQRNVTAERLTEHQLGEAEENPRRGRLPRGGGEDN